MRPLLVTLILLSLMPVVIAQPAPQTVSEADARQHLLQHNDPVYPAIARAAQIQGSVVVKVVIDPVGRVLSEKVLSGPPMLQGAALEAVKTWTFKPFEPTGAQITTTLTIPFELHLNGVGPSEEQQRAAQAVFPLFEKCQNALKAQDVQGSLDACKQALDMSLTAGDITQSDQLTMLLSYQDYGRALTAAGQFQEALAAEKKAIDLAQAHLKDTDQEYAMPFYWRAFPEAHLGQLDAASADLTIAEETHRRAIAHLPEEAKMYNGYLASILKQHAALLDVMGKTADADKLRAEAASLQP